MKTFSPQNVNLELFAGSARPDELVPNVASVPQRSPFRYPGGKTWLVPMVRRWLKSKNQTSSELFEIFAGGATVGLTAAFEGLVKKSILVELDPQVSSVWQVILGPDWKKLANRIVNFTISPESVEVELGKDATSKDELAFQTILRNRVNHGGILAPGSGQIKHGENGKGLKSRWYPDTLFRRISSIAYMRDRLSFVQGDGLKVLEENLSRDDALFFIDPPYTAAGKSAGSRLYTHSELDHEVLFSLSSRIKGDFLMTYDNADSVKQMAKSHGFDSLETSMKNTHHANMTELLIGRNLDWARRIECQDERTSNGA